MPTAFYAGTFDPPTNGHLWVILRALELFDHLIVGVAVNPAKRVSIDDNTRHWLMAGVTLRATGEPVNAEVTLVPSDRYVADVAREMGATHLIRGLRGAEDVLQEQTLADFARERADLTTVVLMPPSLLRGVSSSYVKALIGPVGWEDVVRPLVPRPVFEYLKKERA